MHEASSRAGQAYEQFFSYFSASRSIGIDFFLFCIKAKRKITVNKYLSATIRICHLYFTILLQIPSNMIADSCQLADKSIPP